MLREFWAKHADAEQPLKAWLAVAESATWRTPQEIKDLFRSTSFLSDNRVVFNIGGNRFRLVIHFHYEYGIARIKFIGTHTEYDAINAETI